MVRYGRQLVIILLCIFLIGTLMTGCLGNKQQPEPEQEELEHNPENLGNDEIGTPEYDDYQNRVQQIKLYFAKQIENDSYLVTESRDLSQGQITKETLYRETVEQLIAGPKDEDLDRMVPPATKVKDISQENGTITVNFNKKIKDDFSGGSKVEELLVYSIVNTLTEFPGINNVQILINGEKVESIGGHINISEPLKRDTSLVKSEKE